MDERIIAKLAESEAVSNDLNIDKHLESLRQAHKHGANNTFPGVHDVSDCCFRDGNG